MHEGDQRKQHFYKGKQLSQKKKQRRAQKIMQKIYESQAGKTLLKAKLQQEKDLGDKQSWRILERKRNNEEKDKTIIENAVGRN